MSTRHQREPWIYKKANKRKNDKNIIYFDNLMNKIQPLFIRAKVVSNFLFSIIALFPNFPA
jgi:hypothetical protein